MGGNYDAISFERNLELVYDKVVFWRQNLFKLPTGASGKAYIRELTRLVVAWNSKSNLMNVSWKSIMLMPSLIIQKPAANSKAKDHKEALARRLTLWQKGELLELMKEAETIQKRMKSSKPKRNIEAISKKFSLLMKAGKLNAAVKVLTSNMEGGILPLTEDTIALLEQKHPNPAPIIDDAIIDKVPEDVHPVVFSSIDGESIRKAAIATKGSAGPSGMDADGWRHVLLSGNFSDANKELRNQLAVTAKILATEKTEIFEKNDRPTSSIDAYLACRLVPLDKKPGLRPIGIGEVLRRIIGKTFMSVIKEDVQSVVRSMQVYVGQASRWMRGSNSCHERRV